MNFKNIATITGLATGAAVALTTTPAQAISFTNLGNTCPTVYCVDLAEGGYTVSGGQVLTGNLKPEALTPGSDDSGAFDPDNTAASTLSYNVTSSSPEIEELDPSASEPIVVTGLEGMFEFFWGSVDQHNQIEFKSGGADGATVMTFNGQDLVDALGFTAGVDFEEDLPNNAGNFNFDIYLNFFSEGDGDFFDTVVLSSIPDLVEKGTNGISFEVATKKAIPEPASILGLAAVGILGGGSLLKRKEQAA